MKTFTAYVCNAFRLCTIACGILITLNTGAQNISSAYLHGPVVYINLMLPSADSMLLVDGTAAMYGNKYSANVDIYDAQKLPNFFENICLLRDNEDLAIEARPFPKQNDTLFIQMWGLRQPAYAIQVSIKGIAGVLASEAWLADNYLHTKTPVNLFNNTLYSFSPNSDIASFKNRFMIVFNHNAKQNNIVAPVIHIDDIKVFPNPVAGNRIGLQFSNVSKGKYRVSVSSFTGELLMNTNIIHNGGSSTYYLPLNSVYTKGLYTITISAADAGKIIHLPVILNN